MSEKQTKEVESNINVPYIVYEGAMARMERTVKRLFILVIVTTLIAFVSNIVWLYWWNQYLHQVGGVLHDQGESFSIGSEGRAIADAIFLFIRTCRQRRSDRIRE